MTMLAAYKEFKRVAKGQPLMEWAKETGDVDLLVIVFEDIAATADFFLSAQAGFVTGQVLYVCGGMTVGIVPI